MPQLQSVSSIPSEAVDLLEAVGYMDALELCDSDPQDLIDELVKANKALKIMAVEPTAELLGSWQESAQDALRVEGVSAEGVEIPVSSQVLEELTVPADGGGAVSPVPSVNFEADPDIQSMLEISPSAEPIPAELIKQNNLSVKDIAEGILLTECQGDVEIKVMTAQRRQKHERQVTEVKRSGLMTSRIRNFSEHEEDDHHVKPLEKGEQRDVVSISKGLNKGLTPSSRRFVRGVLHPDPMRVRVSAFFAVLVQAIFTITLLAVPSLIIYDQIYDTPEVMWWIIGVVSCLVLSALAYLIWGLSARCRVCGQRQFAPKKCLKNRKAHHIPVIGYILPTALHAMFYKWFYCTYCGTAVRLKK